MYLNKKLAEQEIYIFIYNLYIINFILFIYNLYIYIYNLYVNTYTRLRHLKLLQKNTQQKTNQTKPTATTTTKKRFEISQYYTDLLLTDIFASKFPSSGS